MKRGINSRDVSWHCW